MSVFADVEDFLQHAPKGSQVHLACPCGVTFEWWVLPQDADEDLLRSALLAGPN